TKELVPSQPTGSEPLLAWSASGKFLAARVGDVHVWNAMTGQLVGRLPLSETSHPITISSDGRLLAVGKVPKGSHAFGHWLGHPGAFNSAIEIWDIASGKRISDWAIHREWINGLALSPDGKILASANMDYTAKLWDVPSGRLRADLT